MSLDTLVNVTITTQTTSVSRAGFGTPLIASHHSVYAGNRVRTYGTLQEMIDDGFLATDKEYLAAAALVAQNPKITSWKVGRADSWTPLSSKQITPVIVAPLDGHVYSLEVESNDGTITPVSFTANSGTVLADITAALQAGINAITGITATDNATSVSVDGDVEGELFSIRKLSPGLSIEDQTDSGGLSTDLAAIAAEDNDWYGLILAHKGTDILNDAAAWVETQRKILIGQTSDTANLTGTGPMSELNTSAYARTAAIFHDDDRAFADAAWMGAQFPKTPGSTTWAFKTLAGIAVSNLTTGQKAAIEGNNGNHYTRVAGVNITFEGKVAAGEFLDVTRFIDALQAGLQEDVFAALVNNEKIAFTDTGINIMVGVVKGRLQQGILDGGLAADPAPVVTAPKAADVPSADKIARRLPDLDFTATLAGAIHKLVISGTISV